MGATRREFIKIGGGGLGATASAFLGGPYTAPFWSLVILTGLLVPLGLELLETRRHLPFVAIIPVLILCGGLALRWILLAAGQSNGFRSLP